MLYRVEAWCRIAGTSDAASLASSTTFMSSGTDYDIFDAGKMTQQTGALPP